MTVMSYAMDAGAETAEEGREILARAGFVTADEDGGITLTDLGARVALGEVKVFIRLGSLEAIE